MEPSENPDFLTRQLITYIGNKRALAAPLEQAIDEVCRRLGGRKLRALDLFSGSGFVARLLKKHSTLVAANDLESFSRAANDCFLTNRNEVSLDELVAHVNRLNAAADAGGVHDGFIRELYSPADDQHIQEGERVFYTNDNARRLDFFRQELDLLPSDVQRLLLGPLLFAASVHVNTGGVFKGFYKDRNTGIGKFGGAAGNAINRIMAPIRLEVPVLSRFQTKYQVFQEDATVLAGELGDFDLVYMDPPYNQHPYGSNYFMLNLLVNYQRPRRVSQISGIPTDWNRSRFNVKKQSLPLLRQLFHTIPARFLLLSFNSEGYVSVDDLKRTLEEFGQVDQQVIQYNTFRASRNLHTRPTHVQEHLFLLDKAG